MYLQIQTQMVLNCGNYLWTRNLLNPVSTYSKYTYSITLDLKLLTLIRGDFNESSRGD